MFAKAVALDVNSGKVDLGIVICTNGVGVTIAANKFKGIRAALCLNVEMAEHARRHNGANVLCMGEINQSFEEAFKMVEKFVNTPIADEERHLRRIEQINSFEEEK